MTPLTAQERGRIKSQLSCSLCNLGAFRLYWLPSRRRILARSVSCTRHFAIPEEAQLIGEYEHGIAARDILADLEELVAQLPEPAPLLPSEPEADPAPPASVAGEGEAIAAADKATPAPHPWRAPAGS